MAGLGTLKIADLPGGGLVANDLMAAMNDPLLPLEGFGGDRGLMLPEHIRVDPEAGSAQDLAACDRNADRCLRCGETGHLVCCDGCPGSYHLECCGGSGSADGGEGEWYCPMCRAAGRDGSSSGNELDSVVGRANIVCRSHGWGGFLRASRGNTTITKIIQHQNKFQQSGFQTVL